MFYKYLSEFSTSQHTCKDRTTNLEVLHGIAKIMGKIQVEENIAVLCLRNVFRTDEDYADDSQPPIKTGTKYSILG